MTESLSIQAIAASPPNVILMTFGLADMACRLADALITSGVFVQFGSATPHWRPSDESTSSSVREQLQSERFRWHPAYVQWIENFERQSIFAYLIISISRFVVLHEVGHIGLGHLRKSLDDDMPILVDGTIGISDDRRSAIVSQAKEIAADSFAFNAHLDYLRAEFSGEPTNPMALLLKRKLIGTSRLQLRWTLISALLTFHLLDTRLWTEVSAKYASHPPAPFRMKSILASALELKWLDLTPDVIAEEVRAAHLLGTAVIAVGLNRYPEMNWIKQVDGPNFDHMFLELFDELHNWTRWEG